MSKPVDFDIIFVRNYQKRVLQDRKLHELYKKVFAIFLKNPEDPVLKNHTLRGKMSSKKAFSVDNDCRVIYKEEKDRYLFLDIGKHDEVYE